MSVFRKITALAFAFPLLGGLGHARAAFPTAALTATGTDTLTYDGLTFSVAASSCAYTLNGVAQSSCANSGDQLAIIASNRGQPTLAIESIAGSNALSCANCSGATTLNFTLVVSRVTSFNQTTDKVTNFSNAITGTPGASTAVFSNVSYTGTGGGASNVNMSSPNNSAAVTSNLTGTNTMSFTVNLGLNALTTGTLQLAMDALHFSPAPEPASIALLVTGLTGLAGARRYIKRDRRSAKELG